ncbi:hypothetical protein [Intestinimonas sp.]|nr:hypothetical protein [Intestinimonas sp.]
MTPAKGFSEMKDSGIEWIGEIPVHWEIARMKSILENVSIKNHPDAEVLSLYRDYGVLPKNSRDDNHNEVMSNWTPNKANTQYSTWQDTLTKMRKNRFIPSGFGIHTLKKKFSYRGSKSCQTTKNNLNRILNPF